MKKIVSFFGDRNEVFETLNTKAAEYAYTLGFEYKWAPQSPFNYESVIEELKCADAGIIDIEPFGESVFKQIKESSKILVRFGVGYDKVDLNAATQNGIAIARTTGANTNGVAEMALTLLLASKRKVKLFGKYVEQENWKKVVVNETLGSTVGILGFGGIGKKLASLLKGFDCKIICYDPQPDLASMKEMGVELVELDTLFRESDAISIHVPYTEKTHKMVNKERLELMKPTSVLINTSRGNIVDEEALFDALKNGIIAGAGFDVFSIEPLPKESPLIGLENMILTPHVSSQTMESLWNIYKTAIDIIYDFYRGIDTHHILNTEYSRMRMNQV